MAEPLALWLHTYSKKYKPKTKQFQKDSWLVQTDTFIINKSMRL